MKFILDLFEKKNIKQVAVELNGEIVHESQNLVIVEAESEYALIMKMKSTFPDIDFNSCEYKN